MIDHDNAMKQAAQTAQFYLDQYLKNEKRNDQVSSSREVESAGFMISASLDYHAYCMLRLEEKIGEINEQLANVAEKLSDN